MSVLTRATQHSIKEDAILHGRLRENVKSYIREDMFPSFCAHLKEPGPLIMTSSFTLIQQIRNFAPINLMLEIYPASKELCFEETPENDQNKQIQIN
jgi:hypothetical protein